MALYVQETYLIVRVYIEGHSRSKINGVWF